MARAAPARARGTPDVSAVVVTYDALPWLERCLESLRGPAAEVIVVDHGSTDGTLELVKTRFLEARVVEQENRGLGGGSNAGMRIASGRYFLLLNSDAWLTEGALERLVAFADDHPEAAVVGPRLLNPDGTLQRSVRGFPTVWRIATEYLFLRKLAPRSRARSRRRRDDDAELGGELPRAGAGASALPRQAPRRARGGARTAADALGAAGARAPLPRRAWARLPGRRAVATVGQGGLAPRIARVKALVVDVGWVNGPAVLR